MSSLTSAAAIVLIRLRRRLRAAAGFAKPEPADQCPLTRCGLGGDVHQW